MSEIKIRKGDKYFEIYQREFYDPFRRMGYFLSTETGEGMEINESNMPCLYDAINKFFQEHM